MQTNYSYEITDGGLKRRIIPLEFTNFFTDRGGLDVHFKAHFLMIGRHKITMGLIRWLLPVFKNGLQLDAN